MLLQRSKEIGIIGLVFASSSCEQAALLAKKIKDVQSAVSEFTATPGEQAFGFLSKTFKDQPINVDAVLEAMNVAHVEKGNANLRLSMGLLEEEADEDVEVSEAGFDVMTSGQAVKSEFVNTDYVQISNDFFEPVNEEAPALTADTVDHSADKVIWSSAKNDFTISSLAKLPVRDQGRRGTCASFAGVAQMEAYLIKTYGLNGIDLSEQRFYYMSKPDTWKDGGLITAEGSNAGTGFAKSKGFEYQAKTFPDDSPTTFNLPLETDCPYNPEKGKTDTQFPQATGCKNTGVAKVTDFRAWLYRFKERVSTAQDIYDMLLDKDIPVLIATKLSDNFETNDGMITLAESGGAGATGHASGHSYMVVGAKKLDEAKYPNEGGLCFYVRNSWGRGWGIDGLSCITLAWFNTWRYPSDFDQADTVELDETKFAEAKKILDTKPTGVKEADKGNAIIPATGKRRGSVTFLTNNLAEDERKLGAFVDDKNRFTKVLYAIEDAKITLYGILDGDENVTQGLELKLEDGKLTNEFATKGTLTVGEIDEKTGIITLCAVKYSQTCVLNYIEDTKQLMVGLTKGAFDKEESQEPYEWKSLAVPGHSIDFNVPGKGTAVDIRFTNKEKATNPLRFRVDPLTGDINYLGQAIGSITKGAFCSGDYKGLCRVVTAGEKFAVLFKANKK
jgi:C1A family cysteine protease